MNPEEFVIQALQYWGLEVSKIQEQEEKTPDFFAIAGDSSYLIELKTKSPNPEALERRNASLDAGELFGESTPMVRRNRLSGIIRSAVEQLDAFDAGSAFQLAWFHSEGYAADAHMEQFEIALYGSTTIVDWSENGSARQCYFFTNSDFFRYRQVLDGAIVSTPAQVKLCLNPLSENYTQLKESFICAALQEGICDPYAYEAEGIAYVVDGDVDRNDKNSVLDFLRKKYEQEKLSDMTMSHRSVTVAVPHGS